MHILLIASFFPPANSIASHRLYSFAKYLPEFGIDVDVITPKRKGNLNLDTSGINVTYPYSDPRSVTKFAKKKNKIRDALKYSGIRSCKHYLTSKFYHSAKKMITADFIAPFDAVMVSYGNEDALRLACYIHKKYKLPLIIDYRDLWYDNLYANWTPLDKLIIYFLEKRIIKKAKLITTVSKNLAEQLAGRYHVKANVIYNGYFDFIKQYAVRFDKPNIATTTFCYCGSLYGGIQPIEVFYPLLAENQNFYLNIAVLDEVDRELVESLNAQYCVRDQVTIYFNLSYEKAIALEKQADFLLFLNRLDGVAKGVLTGKLFEYMALGNKIIGIGHPGDEAGELIRQYSLGCYCHSSIELGVEIKKMLDSAHQPSKDIFLFDRREQARVLAELIKTEIFQ